MCIVSISILLSYLIEGREVVQSTVIDATFSFLAATLLMTAGGMACHTYNQVFALSGPPVIANLNISRNSQQVWISNGRTIRPPEPGPVIVCELKIRVAHCQVAASMGVMCLTTSLIYLADFFYLLCQRNKFLSE